MLMDEKAVTARSQPNLDGRLGVAPSQATFSQENVRPKEKRWLDKAPHGIKIRAPRRSTQFAENANLPV